MVYSKKIFKLQLIYYEIRKFMILLRFICTSTSSDVADYVGRSPKPLAKAKILPPSLKLRRSNRGVAQLVAYLVWDQRVVSSSLATPTKEKARNHSKRGKAFSFWSPQNRIIEGNPASHPDYKVMMLNKIQRFCTNFEPKN